MNIEHVTFNDSPEKIVESRFDCIWIQLEAREAPRPLTSPSLQWLDWKLQGQISRVIVKPTSESAVPTFIPTMKRIAVPYLAIVASGSHDWPDFLKSCRGLKLSRVLYFCEEPGRLLDAERELRQHASEGFPEAISFASDGSVGRAGG